MAPVARLTVTSPRPPYCWPALSAYTTGDWRYQWKLIVDCLEAACSFWRQVVTGLQHRHVTLPPCASPCVPVCASLPLCATKILMQSTRKILDPLFLLECRDFGHWRTSFSSVWRLKTELSKISNVDQLHIAGVGDKPDILILVELCLVHGTAAHRHSTVLLLNFAICGRWDGDAGCWDEGERERGQCPVLSYVELVPPCFHF